MSDHIYPATVATYLEEFLLAGVALFELRRKGIDCFPVMKETIESRGNEAMRRLFEACDGDVSVVYQCVHDRFRMPSVRGEPCPSSIEPA